MNETYFGSDTDIETLKISDEDVDKVKISKLPNRPNSVSAFGGTALSAQKLKEKYDAPTLMIQGKFNDLIDEINKIEGPASAEQNRRAAESLRAEAEKERQKYYENLSECLEMIEDLQEKMIEAGHSANSVLTSVLDAHPVGAIYISLEEKSPANLFGGSWIPVEDCFLLAAGASYSAGESGGSKSHAHGSSEMYAKFDLGIAQNYSGYYNFLEIQPFQIDEQETRIRYGQDQGIDTNTKALFTERGSLGSGGGTAIGGFTDSSSSMPPYWTVYMWRRIA